MRYPLVICYIAIENGPVEIVDFPIKNSGSFHSNCNKLPEGSEEVKESNIGASTGLTTEEAEFLFGGCAKRIRYVEFQRKSCQILDI